MAGKPQRQLVGSKAERLFRLFDDADARSGMRRLAERIGVHRTVLARWALPIDGKKRGGGGRVPPEYNARILEAARELQLQLAAVADLLEPDVCPACGQPMPDGRKL